MRRLFYNRQRLLASSPQELRTMLEDVLRQLEESNLEVEQRLLEVESSALVQNPALPRVDATLQGRFAQLFHRGAQDDELSVLVERDDASLSWQRLYPPSMKARTLAVTAPMVLDDQVVLGDATGGPITLTLPDVAEAKGRLYYIKRINSGANAVTISAV